MTSNFDLKGKAREFWISEDDYCPLVFYSLSDFFEHYEEMREGGVREDLPKPVHLIEYSAYDKLRADLEVAIAERDKWRKMALDMKAELAKHLCFDYADTKGRCSHCMVIEKFNAMLGDKPEGE